MKGDRRPSHYMKGTHIRRKRLVDKDVVADTIPWWDPKTAHEGAGSDDYGTMAAELARRPAMSNSQVALPLGTTDRDSSDVMVSQWWLDPCKYAHIEFAKDVVFIGEQDTKIPAHTRLGEVFPKGLYKLKIGNKVDGPQGRDFRSRWTYNSVHLRTAQGRWRFTKGRLRTAKREDRDYIIKLLVLKSTLRWCSYDY